LAYLGALRVGAKRGANFTGRKVQGWATWLAFIIHAGPPKAAYHTRTRAQKSALAPVPHARHILASMAGSPLKRQRKLGIRDTDGSVIAFPYLRHPRAGLSHAKWRTLSRGEKLEQLFGMSLDDLYEILSWPIGELDPFRLSVRMQVTRVVFMIGVKALLDGKLGREAARERNGDAVLEELDRNLRRRTGRTEGSEEAPMKIAAPPRTAANF